MALLGNRIFNIDFCDLTLSNLRLQFISKMSAKAITIHTYASFPDGYNYDI